MNLLHKGILLLGAFTFQLGCAGAIQGVGKDFGTGVITAVNGQLPDTGRNLMQGINEKLPDTGRGLLQGVNEKLPDTTRGLMKGMGEGLRQDVLNDATIERLIHTLDASGDSAARSAEKLSRVLDRLLATMGPRGEQFSRGLIRGTGRGLQEDVLNSENERKLNALLASLTGTAREQLIGQRTHDELVAVVKDVLGQVGSAADDQRQKLETSLEQAQTRLRNAILGLIVLVVISGAVIAFIVFQWRRQDRLVQLLTLQIDRLPESSSRDALKQRIQELATVGGLERALRKQLAKQGLLEDPSAARPPAKHDEGGGTPG